MIRKIILFCTITLTAHQSHSMNNPQSNNHQDNTLLMCQQVQKILETYNILKSQAFKQVPAKYQDLIETRDKILKERSNELRPIAIACNNNTAKSFLNTWKYKKTNAKGTLQLATTINDLLQQKQ